MDEQRTKMEHSLHLGAGRSSGAADAGENVVELLFDVPVLPRMGREPPVFRPFEDGLFVAKVSEALVPQFPAHRHDPRPVLALGQTARKVVDVGEEFAMLAVDLGISGLERACPTSGGNFAAGVSAAIVPSIIGFMQLPRPASAHKQLMAATALRKIQLAPTECRIAVR